MSESDSQFHSENILGSIFLDCIKQEALRCVRSMMTEIRPSRSGSVTGIAMPDVSHRVSPDDSASSTFTERNSDQRRQELLMRLNKCTALMDQLERGV